jgi:transglutaminase-like putative cysteine protease
MTNDLDRDLRDTFRRHEQDLLGRHPTPAPNMFERIRRRQTGTVLMAALAAAAIAIAGISGLDAIRVSEQTPASSGPGPTASDPFISINAQLDERAVRDLFKVRTEDPQYWRLYTLDVFDGEEWRSSDPDGSVGGQVVTTPTDVLPQAPGYTYPADAESLVQTFRVLSDFGGAHALPMALTAEGIAGPIGDITWDPYLAQAFIDGGLEEGLEYTVRSRIVVPTPEELDRVDHLAPRRYGQWTELPADLDPRFGQMAERWTADATSDYRRVLAIQQHFHGEGFVYSTDVEPADDADAMLEFLTQTKTGFCQQYATAMAVLVRELGIPARLAVGYRAGTEQDDGTYLVQSKDAHAWVEVFFEGYGWLQFEPTPGRGTHPNAQAGTYLNPAAGP